MESFKKRQKEMRRLDRQKDKAARRVQRKLDRAGAAGNASSDTEFNPESGNPPDDAPAPADVITESANLSPHS